MTFRNRNSFFYGWWIVWASFIVSMFVGGVVFYGFTAFFEPIVEDMGWSYTQLSVAASIRGMESGILSPIVGVLVDRWGTRKVLFAGGIAIIIGLVLCAFTKYLAMFYGVFALLGIGASVYLVAPLVAVNNWFKLKTGLANGIAICGMGFSGLMVPLIVSLISAYGWRNALIILAAGLAVIILPLSIVFRHKPEQYGYLPDGQTVYMALSDKHNTENPLAVEPTDIGKETTGAIIKSYRFWGLSLAYIYHSTVVNAVVTHVMPFLSSIGVSRSLSSTIAMCVPLVSIVGRIGLGWLGDRYDRKVVASAGFALLGLGIFCLGYTSNAGFFLLVPFLLILGTGYGGLNSLRPALVGDFFGKAHYGTIIGLLMGINSAGVIIGPTAAGWVYDNWGTYQGIWYFFAGFAVIPVVLIMSIQRSASGR